MRLEEVTSGRLYLDSNILIYIYENNKAFQQPLSVLRGLMASPSCSFCTSLITLAEILVIPLRVNDIELAVAYKQLFASTSILDVIPFTNEVAVEAAMIQSRTRIKLPDALHLASAQVYGSDYFVTSDFALSKLSPVTPVLLTEDR